MSLLLLHLVPGILAFPKAREKEGEKEGEKATFTYTHQMGMKSHILGYLSIWECIPEYWGPLVYRNAFPYSGVPRYIGNSSLVTPKTNHLANDKQWGLDAYIYICMHIHTCLSLGMHAHVLWIWECIPMYCDTPAHESNHIWECIPEYWGPNRHTHTHTSRLT